MNKEAEIKKGAKRLYHFEDRRLNEQFDEILRRLNIGANFPRKGLEAIFKEMFIQEELITDKSVSKNAGILQTKISNKIRAIDADKLDGYESEFFLNLINIEVKENIPAFRFITIDGYLASSSNVNHIGLVAGITLNQANIGETVNVKPFGIIQNKGWNFAEEDLKTIFLRNNGTFDASPPPFGFVQKVGKIVSKDTIFVYLGEPIYL